MRCLALAQAWRRRGGEAVFVSRCTEKLPLDRLHRDQFRIEKIDEPDAGWRVISSLSAARGSWLVLDSYRFTPDDHARAKTFGHRVLVLDDLAAQTSYHVDAVLNSAPVESITPDRYAGAGLALLGPAYVLLREEFLAFENRAYQTVPAVRRVLVTMGGTDPMGLSPRVIKALQKTSFTGEILVTGGASSPTDTISTVDGSPDMATVLASVDVAISGAGSTCWEMAFMGIPSVVIVLADNQWGVANTMSASGAAVNVGWHAAIKDHLLSQAIERVITDPETRSRMSGCGRALIDGHGSDRVVAACLSMN